MKKWIQFLSLTSKINQPITNKVSRKVISDVYTQIQPSLDSLKAYDQGKK